MVYFSTGNAGPDYDGSVRPGDNLFTASIIALATDGAFDTGDIPAGAAASVTFNTPGTYTYNCSPHPWMIGQIIVT